MTMRILAIALLLTTPAHAGMFGAARSIDLDAVKRCTEQVTGLPMHTVPVVVQTDEWAEVVEDTCCDKSGKRFSGTARSTWGINVFTGERTVKLHRSAGFESAVHEFAVDAYVQHGGNFWNKSEIEHLGYRAEWAAKECGK